MATLFFVVTSIAAGETRVWIDEQGREVSAAFAGFSEDGKAVKLRLANGNVTSFPVARLSNACRAHLENLQKTETPATPGTAGQTGEEALNFTSEWPDLVGFRDDPEIQIIREDDEAKEFVYESMNFRFVSDARLSRSVVRGFALMYESTHEYCAAMPIGISKGVRTDGKYLIKLYEKREDYIKAGAPPQSGGVFMGGRNRIKVPFDSLGVKPVGSGYMLDRSVSNRVLAHEIVHQLTPVPYYADHEFNSWFIEGIAEYVATTPYRSGIYNTRNHRRAAVDYATGFSKVDDRGRNIGTDIELKSLKSFMDLPYEQFAGENGNFNYAVGLLVTYYFIHLDGEGDAANLKAYLRALLDGESREQAEQKLLAGRTFEKLQDDFQAAWRRLGVSFKFLY